MRIIPASHCCRQIASDCFGKRQSRACIVKTSHFAVVRLRCGEIQLCHSKIMYPSNIVLYDYVRYDRKKRNRRRPLSRRIHIWLLHFACDSYTMRSIGSCRLLLPLSDCGTSACLFPPSFCPDEIPTYPYLFRSYGKIWERFSASFLRV